jgi:hypothetical protein
MKTSNYLKHLLSVIILISIVTSKNFAQDIRPNTYNYPSHGNVGIGTTNVQDYKLTAASDLHFKIVEECEEPPCFLNGTIPFRILAQDVNFGGELPYGVSITTTLAEARVYDFGANPSSSNRVMHLNRKGVMLLGESINSNPPSFLHTLATDNSIFSGNHLLVQNRLGIGTTNPEAAIDLRNGNAAINGNEIRLRGPNDDNHVLKYTNNFAGFDPDGPILTGYNGGILGTRGAQERGILYWKSNGRIGINNSNPSMALDVNGWVKFDVSSFADGAVQFEPHNNFHRISFNELRFFDWQHGEMLTFNDGYVGINTISPTESLEVNGNTKTNRLITNTLAASNALEVINSGTNNIDFVVKGDGRVFAREIEVLLTTFPDYVFDTNYKLMKLSELKKYVEKEKHLPGIKSAKEIEESGIGLGELTRLQMEKIEELTLYILSQDDKIRQLENRLSELEK